MRRAGTTTPKGAAGAAAAVTGGTSAEGAAQRPFAVVGTVRQRLRSLQPASISSWLFDLHFEPLRTTTRAGEQRKHSGLCKWKSGKESRRSQVSGIFSEEQ
eukprot:CAMPEP_0118921172 /NCGR_PEP_ID=MMETSP1169-20130426/538_1 /TAXON_ID=36882 /ORGANISM="Pyramimonas obovata, Strain CCMP722" /LENGTH=100 /DNA_ID=CAMNT_0006861851 /DNA_START=25 /DNA_END=327 /DNA_ORIENTATION=-